MGISSPGRGLDPCSFTTLPALFQAVSRAALLVALLACAAAMPARPARAAWSALAALERGGALVSASAVDLGTGAVLQQLNADTRLTPASLTKLATAAAVLGVWPADKTFNTRILGTGELRGGRLAGDLVLQGAGDPSLDDQSLWTLASQVKAAGITAVDGRLIVTPAPFGVLGCETKDRCDALERSTNAYNAPLASIGVDFGAWCVAVRPRAPGTTALVRGCGVMDLPIPVEGTIRTVPANARQTFWMERTSSAAGDSLRVGGDIPAGGGQQVYRAMSDPARGVGLLLKETLREIGIRVSGSVVISTAAPPVESYGLAEFQGLRLQEQIGRMLRYSNNYIADVLALDLAASVDGQPPTQLAAAGRVLSDFVARVAPAPAGTVLVPPPLFSGSGLTVENQLSANDLVRLLAWQYRDARHFPAFYGALVVPREAPFDFLRQGSPDWLDRVALKTGTMQDPHSVCGIAGYLRKRDGGWVAFAAIVNGGPVVTRVPLLKAIEAERTDVDDLLARY